MPRRLASEVLFQIHEEDAYSHIALSSALSFSKLEDRDKRLATELVYGTLTWQRSLDRLIDRYAKRGIASFDVLDLIAMRVAIYQMLFLDRVPAHAAINEAVELVKKRGARKGVVGVVNGILRTIDRLEPLELALWRESDKEKRPKRYLGMRYSLPSWIAGVLIDRFGIGRAEQLAQAFTIRPPTYLRSTILVPDADPVEGVPGAWKASSGLDASLRVLLEQDALQVQDLGSQLIGWFCAPSQGDRILDACAGLGGKTALLAQAVGSQGKIMAVEPLLQKSKMSEQMLIRLGLSSRVEHKVLTLQDFSAAHSKELFDVVLVDAPCTGLGVLRRHPEMRWRRAPEDVQELVLVQHALLDEAAKLVRKDGVLVYSVCTFTQEEGPLQVAKFLERHPEFERAPLPDSGSACALPWSRFVHEETQDLVVTPECHDTDAFYAARLVRRRDTLLTLLTPTLQKEAHI